MPASWVAGSGILVLHPALLDENSTYLASGSIGADVDVVDGRVETSRHLTRAYLLDFSQYKDDSKVVGELF